MQQINVTAANLLLPTLSSPFPPYSPFSMPSAGLTTLQPSADASICERITDNELAHGRSVGTAHLVTNNLAVLDLGGCGSARGFIARINGALKGLSNVNSDGEVRLNLQSAAIALHGLCADIEAFVAIPRIQRPEQFIAAMIRERVANEQCSETS